MTLEEAQTLRPGQLVHGRIGQEYLLLEVCSVHLHDSYNGPHCRVRRPGISADGRRFGRKDRSIRDLSLASHLDPQPANVYADWLEENGEPRAAEKLRKAFPLPLPEST